MTIPAQKQQAAISADGQGPSVARSLDAHLRIHLWQVRIASVEVKPEWIIDQEDMGTKTKFWYRDPDELDDFFGAQVFTVELLGYNYEQLKEIV